MIQFHRATFKNFVVLRDVELGFSIDPDKPVTVFRASNGTGKTTSLRAMEWALYGDRALPSPDFQIQPVDWTPEDGKVEVKVELEFSVTQAEPRPGAKPIDKTTRYRLGRSATVTGTTQRGRATRDASLMRLKEGEGWEPIREPKVTIEVLLPFELREFFFTDGDKAMTYVSAGSAATAAQSARASAVEGAVKALLGLDLVEETASRVSDTARRLRSRANKNSQTSLGTLTDVLEGLELKIEAVQDELKEKESAFNRLTEERAELRDRRDRELQRGDAEQLRRDLEIAEKALASARELRAENDGDVARLLSAPSLASALQSKVLERVQEKLRPLNERGIIPASHLQLIREILKDGDCLCGSDISKPGPLRQAVESVLMASEEESLGAGRLGELYYDSARALEECKNPNSHWPSSMGAVVGKDQRLRGIEDEAFRRMSGIASQLKQVDSEALAVVSEQLESTEAALVEVTGAIKARHAELPALVKERDSLAREYRSEAKKQGDLEEILAAQTVATDLSAILERTMEVLQTQKVDEVSEEMNRLFLKMIVADQTPGHDNISRVRLDPNFEILVEGPGGKLLDPDHELNGASRRALTVSFVLALSNVAGVKAPNVIDTPLGMTSGEVRRAVFEVSAAESQQLVLFLTRDETASIEDLLDTHVGQFQTLTNQAHFPNRVMHQTSDLIEVLSCECDHRQYCTVCERVDDQSRGGLIERIA